MDSVAQDVRFALRALLRRPGFSLVAILTLALGVGSSTAVFSVVNGVLLRPLPYNAPEELVIVWSHETGEEPGRGWMSRQDIESVQGSDVVASIQGAAPGNSTVTSLERPERFPTGRVTGGILGVFGMTPHAGRDLRPEESEPGAPLVTVVGYDFWYNQLGGRGDVVGSTLDLDERTFEIVGVAPEGFDYPDGAQIWIPYQRSEGCGRGCLVFRGGVGRLAPGVTLDAGQDRLGSLAVTLAAEYPDSNTNRGLHFESLLDSSVGDVRQGLYVVLGAVGLLLLIACANLANLLLVRASTREGEVAVRAALGASRSRLVSQILTESIVLALSGGLGGILMAVGLVRGFQALAPVDLPRMNEVAVDGTALLVALVTSLTVALLFGMSPAFYLLRGGRSAASGRRAGAGRAEVRARSTLLAAEVALSLLLLAGAGLLTRTLGALYDRDLGFDGEDVVRFSVAVPPARYGDLSSLEGFYDEFEDRLAALPGVEGVGSVFGAPLAGGGISSSVLVEGRPDPELGDETYASIRPATAGYLGVMGIPLTEGRWLEETDHTGTEPVAVVNESFVRQNGLEAEALGARVMVTASFGYSPAEYRRVVGIIPDVNRTLTGEPSAEMYVPHSQFGPNSLTIHLKLRPGASNLIPAAREQLAALDPVLLMRDVETMDQAKRAATATTRFYLLLVGLFAVLAALLAAVGLYGVVAYLVARRTREIGIRIALGARRTTITALVLRQGLIPAACGAAVGVVVALGGGRVMESLLFGIKPSDPWVLAGGTALILVVATAAILIPARRATRVDPREALRAE